MTEKTPQKYGLFILQPNIFLFFYCAPSVFAQARLFLATDSVTRNGATTDILGGNSFTQLKFLPGDLEVNKKVRTFAADRVVHLLKVRPV